MQLSLIQRVAEVTGQTIYMEPFHQSIYYSQRVVNVHAKVTCVRAVSGTNSRLGAFHGSRCRMVGNDIDHRK